MVNWDRIAELQEEIGEDEFDEVLSLFCEEMEEALSSLGDDPASLKADLHALKGSALNIGLDEFGAICQRAEQQPDRASVDAIREAYFAARSSLPLVGDV